MAKYQFSVSLSSAPAQFVKQQCVDNSLNQKAYTSCQGSSKEGVPCPSPCAWHGTLGIGQK